MKINMQLYTFGSFFQSISHLQKAVRVALVKDSEKSTFLSAGEKGQNHTRAPEITARVILAFQKILMDLQLASDGGKRREVRKKEIFTTQCFTEQKFHWGFCLFTFRLCCCALFSSLVWNDLPNSILEGQVHQQYKSPTAVKILTFL